MENHGLQCGYCTPGMVMAATSLLDENPHPTEQEVRIGLEGNLCRCTGYHNIVQAVLAAAERLSGATVSMTVTEDRRRHGRHRPAAAAPGGPGPAHRRGQFTNDLADPGRAAPRAGAQPVRPRPHHVDRHVGGGRAARRRRRLHRRRPRRRVGGADAVRLAGHRRHEEPGALPAGRRQGRATSATASPRCSPPARRAARDAVEAVDVEYEPLEAVIDLEDALSRPGRHPRRPRHQQELHVGAQGRGRGGRRRQGVRRAAVHTVSERYVQQRLMPMAMETARRRRRAAAVRRRHHAVLGDADPAHPQADDGHHARHPRAPGARRRAGGRRRLRLQAQRLRRGAAVRGAGPQAPACRCAGTRSRSENALATIHGRGQIQHIELAADADGKLTGAPGPPDRRHGRLPPARHAGHPAARRVPVRRRVRPAAGVRLRVHVGVHDDDARPTPTAAPGGPEATYAIERAMDALAAKIGVDPLELRRRNFIAKDAVPVHGVERARLRLRRPRRRRHQGRPPRRLRRAAGPPGRRRTSRARPSASASACRRTSRCAAWPRRGCSPR